jgi:hypothetical protein
MEPVSCETYELFFWNFLSHISYRCLPQKEKLGPNARAVSLISAWFSEKKVDREI